VSATDSTTRWALEGKREGGREGGREDVPAPVTTHMRRDHALESDLKIPDPIRLLDPSVLIRHHPGGNLNQTSVVGVHVRLTAVIYTVGDGKTVPRDLNDKIADFPD